MRSSRGSPSCLAQLSFCEFIVSGLELPHEWSLDFCVSFSGLLGSGSWSLTQVTH